MYPSDEWLLLLNFYLIVNSGGTLTTNDFSDARLAETYRETPGESFADMDTTASKLVLEFQAKQENTEVKNSPTGDEGTDGPNLAQRGQTEEYLNGPIPVPMLGVPADV